MAKALCVVKNAYLLNGRELFCPKEKEQLCIMIEHIFFFFFDQLQKINKTCFYLSSKTYMAYKFADLILFFNC